MRLIALPGLAVLPIASRKPAGVFFFKLLINEMIILIAEVNYFVPILHYYVKGIEVYAAILGVE